MKENFSIGMGISDFYIAKNELEKTFDNVDDLYVINHGIGYINSLDRQVSVLNDFLLIIKDIDSELFSVIKNIVEKINNLLFFELNYITNDYANDVLDKYNNFEYKSLNLSDIKRISSIHKLSTLNMSKDEFFKSDDYNTGYYLVNDKEDNYVYICSKENKHKCLFSVINGNSKESICRSFREILSQLTSISVNNTILDKIELDYMPIVEISTDDYHLEVIHLMKYLYMKLSYILNSNSFRYNTLYAFDYMEINQDDINEHFNYSLLRGKQLVEYALKQNNRY